MPRRLGAASVSSNAYSRRSDAIELDNPLSGGLSKDDDEMTYIKSIRERSNAIQRETANRVREFSSQKQNQSTTTIHNKPRRKPSPSPARFPLKKESIQDRSAGFPHPRRKPSPSPARYPVQQDSEQDNSAAGSKKLLIRAPTASRAPSKSTAYDWASSSFGPSYIPSRTKPKLKEPAQAASASTMDDSSISTKLSTLASSNDSSSVSQSRPDEESFLEASLFTEPSQAVSQSRKMDNNNSRPGPNPLFGAVAQKKPENQEKSDETRPPIHPLKVLQGRKGIGANSGAVEEVEHEGWEHGEDYGDAGDFQETHHEGDEEERMSQNPADDDSEDEDDESIEDAEDAHELNEHDDNNNMEVSYRSSSGRPPPPATPPSTANKTPRRSHFFGRRTPRSASPANEDAQTPNSKKRFGWRTPKKSKNTNSNPAEDDGTRSSQGSATRRFFGLRTPKGSLLPDSANEKEDDTIATSQGSDAKQKSSDGGSATEAGSSFTDRSSVRKEETAAMRSKRQHGFARQKNRSKASAMAAAVSTGAKAPANTAESETPPPPNESEETNAEVKHALSESEAGQSVATATQILLSLQEASEQHNNPTVMPHHSNVVKKQDQQIVHADATARPTVDEQPKSAQARETSQETQSSAQENPLVHPPQAAHPSPPTSSGEQNQPSSNEGLARPLVQRSKEVGMKRTSTSASRKKKFKQPRKKTITVEKAKELLLARTSLQIYEPSPARLEPENNHMAWFSATNYLQKKQCVDEAIKDATLQEWLGFALQSIQAAQAGLTIGDDGSEPTVQPEQTSASAQKDDENQDASEEKNPSVESENDASPDNENQSLLNEYSDQNGRSRTETTVGTHQSAGEARRVASSKTKATATADDSDDDDEDDEDDDRSVSSFEVLFNCATCSVFPYDPAGHMHNEEDYFGGSLQATFMKQLPEKWKRANSMVS